MKFSYYDLKTVEKGKIIEVELSAQANVRLLDSNNYSNYKNGRKYHFYGGLVTKSPFKLVVPRTGHWYVVIDLGGYNGRVRHSCRVLPGFASKANVNNNVFNVPTLLHNDENKEYDVFISHASEDKDDVVRPLANSLREKGLKVWYDEFEMKIGDSLRRKIDIGIANSRFGIVVISKAFMSKGWTNYELDGIISKAVSGEQILLPIWHNVTKQEIMNYSPSLLDKVAMNTANDTIEEIAIAIDSVIKGGE